MACNSGCIAISSEDTPAVEALDPSLNATALREKRQRRKLRLKKLEKRLEILDRHIKKCSEAEVTLDEMKTGYNSAYIKEDLLKRKFLKTWQELCSLQHVTDSIVIEDKEKCSYDGTRYPDVNRRIQRLLRLDEFPDYVDILQLLDRCNSKYSLGIATDERCKLARKIFKDVGKIIKRCRHRDFVHHFGSHLTDNLSSSSDPADSDEGLLKRLQESQRKGEEKMRDIVEEFVARQEQEGHQDGDSCSVNEQEEEEEEDEEEEEEEGEKEDKEVDKAIEEALCAESGDEMEVDQNHHHPPPPTTTTSIGGEKKEEEEEEEESERLSGRYEQEPSVVADSTTLHSDSTEVSSTHHQKHGGERRERREKEEVPGPSGLASSQITSSSDVVCLDDDDDEDDIIVLSD